MKPKAIYQKQIWDEHGYENFIKALGCYFELFEVKVIPFTESIEPDIDFVPDIVLGSGRLVDIARKRLWPTFESFEPIEERYFGKNMFINGENVELEIGAFNLIASSGNKFIKPVREKLFTGKVIDTSKPLEAQVQFATSGVADIDKELIIISEAVKIVCEYRMVFIDGVFISGSMYKNNGVAEYCDYEDGLDYAKITNFIESIDIPIFTGALDLGKMQDDSFKIVEMNNLNSAGLYACDHHKVAKGFFDLIELRR